MFTNWAIDRGPHFVYFWGPPGPVALGSTLTASLQWFASLWSHLPFVPGRFLAWTKLLDTQSVSECLGVWNISIGFYRYLMIYWIYCTVHVYLYLYIYIAWGMYLFPTCRPLCIHPLHVVWGVYSWQIRHNWSVWRCGSWIKHECVHHLWCILCKSENM